jgi:uncharacterized phage protein gp47/JayE
VTILATIACTITDAGISRPAYADIWDTLRAKFQSIYGTDAYIAPDSQDGQLLAIFAKGQDDANAATVAAYNNLSPATSQGNGLSNAVKINGLKRNIPTNSQVNLDVGGTVGTVIAGGIATDTGGNRWFLPASVTIPMAGTITVTATAEFPGAISAPVGTVTTIANPMLGWTSVNNSSAAVAGAPVETDAALRARQMVSTGMPAQAILGSLKAAILALTGVTACRIYENDSNVTDSNGLPAHSISAVVQGGASADIANALMLKKTPGCYTYGSTSVAVVDPSGNAATMRYYVPTPMRVIAGIGIKALPGYVSATGTALCAAVATYINALGIGYSLYIRRLDVPAQLSFAPGSGFDTFELTSLQVAFYGNALGTADLTVAFNQIATCQPSDITLTVS